MYIYDCLKYIQQSELYIILNRCFFPKDISFENQTPKYHNFKTNYQTISTHECHSQVEFKLNCTRE